MSLYAQTYCRKRIAWEGLKMNVKFYFECKLLLMFQLTICHQKKTEERIFWGKSFNEMEQKDSEIMVLSFWFIFRVVNSPVAQQTPLCCLLIFSTVPPLYCCHNQNKPEHKWKFSNGLSEEFWCLLINIFSLQSRFVQRLLFHSVSDNLDLILPSNTCLC